jgi:hypothetical protein
MSYVIDLPSKENELDMLCRDLRHSEAKLKCSEAKVLELELALEVLARRCAPDLSKRERSVDNCPTIDMGRKCVFSKKTDADCAECWHKFAIRQARKNLNRRKR